LVLIGISEQKCGTLFASWGRRRLRYQYHQYCPSWFHQISQIDSELPPQFVRKDPAEDGPTVSFRCFVSGD
jgi:hypothetical protein